MKTSLCVDVNRINANHNSPFAVGFACSCLLGSKPNWTDNGCVTVAHGDNVTCQCSHLTFFAVLLVCFTLLTLFVLAATTCHPIVSLYTKLAVTRFATCKQRLSRFCSLQTLNDTISSSDLNRLTIITQVGCSLSMLFLAVVLFMHFLLR